MSEDDVLNEFGFDPTERLAKRGRGKVHDLTGRKCGKFVCIRRHDKNKKSGEAMWVLKCEDCSGERIAPATVVKNGSLRCVTCQGRSGNPKPHNVVSDWGVRFDEIKAELRLAVANDVDEEILSIAARLIYAAKKRGGSSR